MERTTVVDIRVNQGAPHMETAPTPSDTTSIRTAESLTTAPEPVDQTSTSGVSITLVGAGGAGANLVRPFVNDHRINKLYRFDTSLTNVKGDEKVNILTNGSGSGSNRAENAADIQREIDKLSDKHLGVNDVAIVVFSLGGGSGSVVGPLLLREYCRKGVRPIAVLIADTTSAVSAKNTLNTLKTITAIANNNGLYIPVLLFTNDNVNRRGAVDELVLTHVSTLIALLTSPTYEVDRNDRLNWINSSKVSNASSGVKIIKLSTEGLKTNPEIVLGAESTEMVDSLLILLKNADEAIDTPLPPSRLKKTGFFTKDFPQIVGSVSSDISDIDKIIDRVEKMQHTESAHTQKNVDRLKSSGSDDLIL